MSLDLLRTPRPATEAAIRDTMEGWFYRIVQRDDGLTYVQAQNHCPGFTPDYHTLITHISSEQRSEIAKRSAATRKAMGMVLGRPPEVTA